MKNPPSGCRVLVYFLAALAAGAGDVATVFRHGDTLDGPHSCRRRPFTQPLWLSAMGFVGFGVYLGGGCRRAGVETTPLTVRRFSGLAADFSRC
jgi:hypothetical protein